MHEITLLAGIMKQIEQIVAQEDADAVTRVRIKLGALAHISPDHFREHFVHAAQDTAAAGAELLITQADDPEDPLAQEIILESIDVR